MIFILVLFLFFFFSQTVSLSLCICATWRGTTRLRYPGLLSLVTDPSAKPLHPWSGYDPVFEWQPFPALNLLFLRPLSLTFFQPKCVSRRKTRGGDVSEDWGLWGVDLTFFQPKCVSRRKTRGGDVSEDWGLWGVDLTFLHTPTSPHRSLQERDYKKKSKEITG
ncbi:hypothetical protein LY76DRAFT_191717 [Colletotrichum caudatum]|nr:hypothetical protein LY76DRAFT_191717 [Colletotrichum caudatum]